MTEARMSGAFTVTKHKLFRHPITKCIVSTITGNVVRSRWYQNISLLCAYGSSLCFHCQCFSAL